MNPICAGFYPASEMARLRAGGGGLVNSQADHSARQTAGVASTAAAFGCGACHEVLDGRRQRPADLSLAELEATFYAAVRRTHEILRSLGLLDAVPGAATTNLEHL